MGASVTKNLIRIFATGVLPALRNPDNPSFPVGPAKSPTSNNTDVGLSVTELITKYGYPVEEHSVETSDGYILGLQRIPYGKNSTSNDTIKPAVFVMAGLLCSAADWIVAGPDKALGYILADEGYDVWLGNARGTTHSRKHVKYNPDTDREFWMFSWHEMGIYDLPAVIDYILEQTARDQLYYVGHSQGTTSFFVMASERPEYNKKVKVMAALAPVAFMRHVKNQLVQQLSPFEKQLQLFTDHLGRYEVLPDTPLTTAFGDIICNEAADSRSLCKNILFMIAGYDSKQLNKTMVPAILSNLPAGASTRQLYHYAQSINSGKFRQYDEGLRGNQKKYNSFLPPSYNLDKISTPIGLFYSNNDLLTAPKDVRYLEKRLPNVVKDFNVPNKLFNHLDFLYAIDVVEQVYDPVIQFFSDYID